MLTRKGRPRVLWSKSNTKEVTSTLSKSILFTPAAGDALEEPKPRVQLSTAPAVDQTDSASFRSFVPNFVLRCSKEAKRRPVLSHLKEEVAKKASSVDGYVSQKQHLQVELMSVLDLGLSQIHQILRKASFHKKVSSSSLEVGEGNSGMIHEVLHIIRSVDQCVSAAWPALFPRVDLVDHAEALNSCCAEAQDALSVFVRLVMTSFQQELEVSGNSKESTELGSLLLRLQIFAARGRIERSSSFFSQFSGSSQEEELWSLWLDQVLNSSAMIVGPSYFSDDFVQGREGSGIKERSEKRAAKKKEELLRMLSNFRSCFRGVMEHGEVVKSDVSAKLVRLLGSKVKTVETPTAHVLDDPASITTTSSPILAGLTTNDVPSVLALAGDLAIQGKGIESAELFGSIPPDEVLRAIHVSHSVCLSEVLGHLFVIATAVGGQIYNLAVNNLHQVLDATSTTANNNIIMTEETVSVLKQLTDKISEIVHRSEQLCIFSSFPMRSRAESLERGRFLTYILIGALQCGLQGQARVGVRSKEQGLGDNNLHLREESGEAESFFSSSAISSFPLNKRMLTLQPSPSPSW